MHAVSHQAEERSSGTFNVEHVVGLPRRMRISVETLGVRVGKFGVLDHMGAQIVIVNGVYLVPPLPRAHDILKQGSAVSPALA